MNNWTPILNAFCPTGSGGGQDNSCGSKEGGQSDGSKAFLLGPKSHYDVKAGQARAISDRLYQMASSKSQDYKTLKSLAASASQAHKAAAAATTDREDRKFHEDMAATYDKQHQGWSKLVK